MQCNDTLELIDAYVDSELDLVRSVEIEEHLKECHGCSRVFEDHRAMHAAFAESSLYYKPPAGLERRVQRSIRKEAKAQSRPAVWSARWLAMASSLALVAVLSVSLTLTLSRRSEDDSLTQEVIDSHVRSLMLEHIADVRTSDQHTVKPWFNGKVDFSPPVPDLVQQGFPLFGGRLDYADNRAVVALVYQRRQHFINLFIWPAAADKPETGIARQGFNLVRWGRSGMTYWAVSDLNANELREFVRDFQTAAAAP